MAAVSPTGTRSRVGGKMLAISALVLVCIAFLAGISGVSSRVELESWEQSESSIWGEVATHAKVQRRAQALHADHIRGMAQAKGDTSLGEVSSILSPEKIYDAAFHDAFHHSFAKTYGRSMGEEEGRLAAEATWAEAQISSMAKQPEPAYHNGKAPASDMKLPKTIQTAQKAAASAVAGGTGAATVVADATGGGEEVPIGLPQDIRHYIKPSGMWVKGALSTPAMSAAQGSGSSSPPAGTPYEGSDGTASGVAAAPKKSSFPFHRVRAYNSMPLDGFKPHLHAGPEYAGGKERFSPNIKHCGSGNCTPLEEAGVNVDSWRTFPVGPRTLALPGLDPSSDPKASRAQNQRTGRWARYNVGDNPGRWGQEAEPLADPTAYRLENHGVNVMGDAGANAVMHNAFPLPVLDDSEIDKRTMRTRLAPKSAKEAIAAERESDERLERAGVLVNGVPTDAARRAFNHADGIPDRLVRVKGGAVPKWRKGGVGQLEQPEINLLRDTPASETQARLGDDGWEAVGEGDVEAKLGAGRFKFENPFMDGQYVRETDSEREGADSEEGAHSDVEEEGEKGAHSDVEEEGEKGAHSDVEEEGEKGAHSDVEEEGEKGAHSDVEEEGEKGAHSDVEEEGKAEVDGRGLVGLLAKKGGPKKASLQSTWGSIAG